MWERISQNTWWNDDGIVCREVFLLSIWVSSFDDLPFRNWQWMLCSDTRIYKFTHVANKHILDRQMDALNKSQIPVHCTSEILWNGCPDLFGHALCMPGANYCNKSCLFYKIWIISIKHAKQFRIINIRNVNVPDFIWNSVSKLISVNTYYLTYFASRELFLHVTTRQVTGPQGMRLSSSCFSHVIPTLYLCICWRGGILSVLLDPQVFSGREVFCFHWHLT